MVAAAGLSAVVPFLVLDANQSMTDAEMVADDRVCTSETPQPCLSQVTGQLLGPRWTRRSPGDEWTLMVDGDDYDRFDLDPSLNGAVASVRGQATALVSDGNVVGVRVPTAGEDAVAPALDLGAKGAVQSWLFAFFCAGGAVGAASWGWRVGRAGPWQAQPSRWAAVFMFPASVAMILMLVGVPWWQVWVGAGAVVLVAALVMVAPPGVVRFLLRGWPSRRRGRHEADLA